MRESLSEAAGVDLSQETVNRLTTFKELVEKWNPRINLVSRTTLGEIWTRHILDSVQLYRVAPNSVRIWADLGSGGGFPGLVLATIAMQIAPEREHVLIEADQRKAVFLREASRTLGCRATIHSGRIEQVSPAGADVVTARALAPLPVLFGLVARHMLPGGMAILPKGTSHQEELAAARTGWNFDVHVHSSLTDSQGRILQVTNLSERAEDRKLP